MSRRDRIRLGILAVLIVGFSIALALILGRVNYDVLYSGLAPAEAGQIMTALQDMGVPVKTQGSDTILVPADRTGELRMRLASEGYASSTTPDTSLIERTLGFGITDTDRTTFERLQAEVNLGNAIARFDRIEDCVVSLDIPRDSLYAKTETKQAHATVQLTVNDGGKLSSAEAFNIGRYVSNWVGNLPLENISIIDTKMNLYPLSESNEGSGGNGANAIDYQLVLTEQVQQSLENQIITLLNPVFGEGHVNAAVSVTLDFDKTTVSSVEFAPPVEDETEGIMVSMKELYESSRDSALAAGQPGTDTNAVDTPEYPYLPLNSDEYYRKALREINYEINETRTNIERAQGTIRNLSIAVMLDSAAMEEDYSENVRNLVAQAIGVNNRYISVERMPFLPMDDNFAKAKEEQDAYQRSLQIFELIKTGIIALAVILLVVLILSFIRTVIRTYAPASAAPALAMAGIGPGGSVDYLAMEEGVVGLPEPEVEIPVSSKSEEITQIENFIERDPQAVAQLLRNWLSDDYR